MKRRGILWFVVAVATVGVLLALSGGCVQQESRVPNANEGVLKQGQAGTTLSATKTATGFWEQHIIYNWTVEKSAREARIYDDKGILKETITNPEGSSITLEKGWQAEIDYEIVAARTKVEEKETTGVRGQITVKNGGDRTTENLKLVDQVEYKTGAGQFQSLPGASQTIIPSAQLEPGTTGTYDYEVTFTPIPEAIYRNTVKVTITNHSGRLGKEFGPEPKADFSLPGEPATSETDASATVKDDIAMVLGKLPQGFTWEIKGGQDTWTLNDSGTITYTVVITNNGACGEGSIDIENTATLTENDSKEQCTDTAKVTIVLPACAVVSSCTYTQGYWKTHSKYGPAKPYNETWAKIGEDTPFFKSGKSYYQVLWTNPSGGNAYYILAHQYIAAKLNILNGASSTPEVDAALVWAESFFNTYKPNDKLSSNTRSQALSYANLLDQYNNGSIGPGHCSAE